MTHVMIPAVHEVATLPAGGWHACGVGGGVCTFLNRSLDLHGYVWPCFRRHKPRCQDFGSSWAVGDFLGLSNTFLDDVCPI